MSVAWPFMQDGSADQKGSKVGEPGAPRALSTLGPTRHRGPVLYPELPDQKGLHARRRESILAEAGTHTLRPPASYST